MTIDQIAIFCIIVFTFILFVWGKWRYDIVSIIALCTLFIADLLLGNDVDVGFGTTMNIIDDPLVATSFSGQVDVNALDIELDAADQVIIDAASTAVDAMTLNSAGGIRIDAAAQALELEARRMCAGRAAVEDVA